MAWLLLGYDVENPDPDSPVTERFMRVATRVHRELEAPGTFFLCGRTVESNVDAIRAALNTGLFDAGQHTYSHVRFKTLWQVNEEGETVHEGGSVAEIAREVDRASTVIRELLGVEVEGLTTPWGYYRGLGDRPDLLAILHLAGIRYVRSWMRNERDWVPVPLDRQPFFYAAQGFPELLELPLTVRHDCDWGNHLGFEPRRYDSVEPYARFVADQLEQVAAKDWVFVYNQHDTTTVRWDPEMVVVQTLIERARELGISVGLYRECYEERLREGEGG
ncbi:MAG: polysaccharide deacetylase family protein [Armatimonadota bacterium]|nr:polysaccharide deacetylase family protein [Armatimonadota bacterium]